MSLNLSRPERIKKHIRQFFITLGWLVLLILIGIIGFNAIPPATAYEGQKFNDGKSTPEMPLVLTKDSFDIVQVREGLICVWDGYNKKQLLLDCDWVGYHRYLDEKKKETKPVVSKPVMEDGVQKLEYPYN